MDELRTRFIEVVPRGSHCGRPVQNQSIRSESPPRTRNLSPILRFVIAFVTASIVFGLLVPFCLVFDPPNKAKVVDVSNCQFQCNQSSEVPPLLVVCFDGFRADYLHRNLTPTLKRLFDCGVQAPHMVPSFPSITFPNYYTIMTGLFPGYHGIIDKDLFGVDENTPGEDESLDKRRILKAYNLERPWYGGEPIWNTVEKAGRKAAANTWPADKRIQGLSPSFLEKYNQAKTYEQNIDDTIRLLSLPPADRPDFAVFYTHEPDGAGHNYGPDSPEVEKMLHRTENIVTYLLKRLDEAGLLGCINLVFVSDHGMEALRQDPKQHGRFSDVVGNLSVNATAVTSTVGHVYLESEDVPANSSLLDGFNVCRGGDPFVAWTRQNIPRRYHYTNKRVGSLVFESAPGSMFFSDKVTLRKGEHGYDPLHPHMSAIFGAIGPSFKTNLTIAPFQNVELYNLFVDLLQLPNRAPNNGTVGRLHEVLQNPPQTVDETLRVQPCITHIDHSCFKNGTLTSFKSKSQLCLSYNARCEVQLFKKASKLSSGTMYPLAKTFLVSQTQPFHTETLLSAFSTVHADVVHQSKAFKYVQKLIGNYVQEFSQLLVFVGAITDTNNNGIADDADDTSQLTHYFIVLQNCQSLVVSGGPFCENVETAEFLSLVLPVEIKDHNCLSIENYLFRHTARLRDIELLTGFEFDLTVNVRTKLLTNWWNSK